MNETLKQLVRQRAGARCEYCHLPQDYDVLPFQIDHIIALKHRGLTTAANLAWSCFNCNSFKGPNIASIDSVTNELTPLFHPRQDLWDIHFIWEGPQLIGQTAIGRTTIEVLSINLPERIELRRYLMALDVAF
jgi:5-methylcytosine-specific restriction endonuclease McrA